MGRVMSVVGVPMLLAPVLGPVIGGAIVENLSWRWIFLVNLPVGIVGLLLARRLLPSGRAVGRASADGQRAAGAGLARARAPLPWGRGDRLRHLGVRSASHLRGDRARGCRSSSARWPSPPSSSTACASRYPIVDVGLFRSGGFAAAAATVFLTGIALFGSMILLPLYYQIARGESPLIAGLLVAPRDSAP